MDLSTFFSKFDQFADAPDAVAKMRGLILRLAMQGRLSEPHKTDGPVSELLREVEKDKIRLGLARSAKTTGENPGPSNDETVDVIPDRWAWVSFGSIARHNAGKTLDQGRNRGELRDYITTSNLYWGFFQLDAVRQMPILDDELERCTAIKGDLLICEGGEAGRAAVWPHDREISFQNHVHRARLFAAINPYFVQRYFEKLNATGEIAKYRKGVGISNMSGKALASIPIPLPPLAEQKRIAAKVDELMALCDRLEAQQQERETRHAALARASLARFAEAPTPANLEWIFHPSYPIPPADLRKAILTLAVQGKLVPQDPNDEPAEKFLNRTKARHIQSFNGSKSRKEKGTTAIADDEIPFALPDSWAWCRLETIADKVTDGEHLSPVKTASGMPLLTATHVTAQGVTLNSPQYVSIEDGHKSRQRCDPTRGDVLICSRGTIGRCAVVETDEVFCLMGSVILVRFPSESSPRYFNYFLSTDLAQTEMRGMSGATAVQALYLKDIRQSLVPIPPLAEQRRIVAKVDQLMALVDSLETQLAASRATAANLLSALVAELTATAQAPTPARSPQLAQPSPQPTPARKGLNQHFARAVLSAEIVHRLHDEPTFGRVKHQKIFHLCEHIAEIEEISGQYHREAAGPLDNRLIYANEGELKKQQWYAEVPRKPYGHAYVPLPKAGSHHKFLEGFGSDKVGVIERLIELMRKWDTDRCEIFCTAYAAWNDLLIWKKEPTEEAILHQILDCWNPAKKRFPRERWLAALKWMREHDFAPTGFGKPTAQP